MKTIFRIISALVVVCLAASCAKEVSVDKTPEGGASEGCVQITFTPTVEGKVVTNGKTTLVPNGNVYDVIFNDGDAVSVFDGTANRKFIYNKTTGVFAGEASDVDNYIAFYPYNQSAQMSEGKVSAVCIPAVQTAVSGTYDPAANISIAVSGVEGNKRYLNFLNVATLAKITIPSDDADAVYDKITIEGNDDEILAGGSIVVNASDATFTLPEAGEKVVTLNGPFEKGNTYFIAMYPNTFSEGLTIRGYKGSKIIAFKHGHASNEFKRAIPNNCKMLYPTIPIPDPLPGTFTINDNGDKVQFAPGNLQYQASSGRWRFASEQYYALNTREESGNETPCLDKDGNIVVYEYLHGHVAKGATPKTKPAAGRVTQDKWIDLFGYACTGDNHVHEKCMVYQPWEAFVESTDDRNYYYSLDELSVDDHSDWGYVVSGTTENAWFTLSSSEWDYITGYQGNDGLKPGVFGRRKGETNPPLCLYIRIQEKDSENLVNGLLLLPDDWTWPSEAGVEPEDYYNCPTSYHGTRAPIAPVYNDDTSHYTYLEYSWLLHNGAVFLPCTGFRHSQIFKNDGCTEKGTYVKSQDVLGCYWTRTNHVGGGTYPAAFGFYPNNGSTSSREPRANKQFAGGYDANYRDQGYAVRLVKKYTGE